MISFAGRTCLCSSWKGPGNIHEGNPPLLTFVTDWVINTRLSVFELLYWNQSDRSISTTLQTELLTKNNNLTHSKFLFFLLSYLVNGPHYTFISLLAFDYALCIDKIADRQPSRRLGTLIFVDVLKWTTLACCNQVNPMDHSKLIKQ